LIDSAVIFGITGHITPYRTSPNTCDRPGVVQRIRCESGFYTRSRGSDFRRAVTDHDLSAKTGSDTELEHATRLLAHLDLKSDEKALPPKGACCAPFEVIILEKAGFFRKNFKERDRLKGL
jgi:hypothetical protein